MKVKYGSIVFGTGRHLSWTLKRLLPLCDTVDRPETIGTHTDGKFAPKHLRILLDMLLKTMMIIIPEAF